VDEPRARAGSTRLAWFARDIADLRDLSRFRASHGCDPNVEKHHVNRRATAFLRPYFQGLFEARRREMRSGLWQSFQRPAENLQASRGPRKAMCVHLAATDVAG
jgi:hypothetical protein